MERLAGGVVGGLSRLVAPCRICQCFAGWGTDGHEGEGNKGEAACADLRGFFWRAADLRTRYKLPGFGQFASMSGLSQHGQRS